MPEALGFAGGFGFGTYVIFTPSLCDFLTQPTLWTSACLPDFRPSVLWIFSSAENVPGAGCWRFGGMLIVIFWPLPAFVIVAGSACWTPLSRTGPPSLAVCCR